MPMRDENRRIERPHLFRHDGTASMEGVRCHSCLVRLVGDDSCHGRSTQLGHVLRTSPAELRQPQALSRSSRTTMMMYPRAPTIVGLRLQIRIQVLSLMLLSHISCPCFNECLLLPLRDSIWLPNTCFVPPRRWDPAEPFNWVEAVCLRLRHLPWWQQGSHCLHCLYCLRCLHSVH